jgi:two-component system, NarL family, response regulator DegU
LLVLPAATSLHDAFRTSITLVVVGNCATPLTLGMSLLRGDTMALRVLFAEDSPVVQQSVRDLLMSAADVSVVTADNGLEAVRLARQTVPDVVILDDAMPGMNGIDAARLIRQEWPDMPVILLTASAAEYLIAAALNAGIRGYVLKGDAGDDLVRAIYAVRRGSTYVSPGASRVLYERYLPNSGVA